eukprot:TRINITY_DN7724_c0_g1_i1.p2 TRINITY_DN7724_c0_g1~~TRINITY_DN7724_c0_g1_i1.p2  ORF type:complete len:161 (+),score=19.02 TRINITY_DN7724_c0_g1_i1:89-571(+)
MRVVIQRVKSASVTVEGSIVSQIGSGLVCLVGIREGDRQEDADYICRKLLNLRVWPDSNNGKAWQMNVQQLNYEILFVSQFTLHASLKKNKPDYKLAMGPVEAKQFYEDFVAQVRKTYRSDLIKDGVFGAMMDVALVNDGPVTYVLDTWERGASSSDETD